MRRMHWMGGARWFGRCGMGQGDRALRAPAGYTDLCCFEGCRPYCALEAVQHGVANRRGAGAYAWHCLATLPTVLCAGLRLPHGFVKAVLRMAVRILCPGVLRSSLWLVKEPFVPRPASTSSATPHLMCAEEEGRALSSASSTVIQLCCEPTHLPCCFPFTNREPARFRPMFPPANHRTTPVVSHFLRGSASIRRRITLSS